MIRRLLLIAQVTAIYGVFAATLVSAGCAQSTSRDDGLETLTIAVKNNPDLELVATDAEAKILTVRVKSADRVITVTPDDLEDGRLVIPDDESERAASSSGGQGATPSAPADEQSTPASGAQVGVSGKRDQTRVKSGADGVSVDADGRQVDIAGDKGSVSVDADGRQVDIAGDKGSVSVGAGGRQVDIAGDKGGVSVGAGGRQVDIAGDKGGVSVGAGGRQVDIAGDKGGVSVDAGGRRVDIAGATGGVAVTSPDDRENTRPQAEPQAPEASDADAQTPSPPSQGAGERIVIPDNKRQETIECEGHEVVVMGNYNELTLVGECARVELVGNFNSVEAEAVGVIYAPGRENEVVWERGVDAAEPKIINPGSDNVIKRAGG